VGLRLEFVGSFVILFASLVAALKKNTISPGVAGLSISYAITVNKKPILITKNRLKYRNVIFKKTTQSLLWSVRSFSEFETNLTSVERISEYCELPNHEVYFEIKLISKKYRTIKILVIIKAEWDIEKTKPDETWPSKGEIEFKDYSVKYREELDFVLRDITVKIKSGEKVRYLWLAIEYLQFI